MTQDATALKVDPKAAYAFRKDGTPRKRSNQFIAAREQRIAFKTAEDHRQRIKTGMLLAKLHKAASGKLTLDASQVQACKILLDKAIPTLQSVETVNLEPAVTRTEHDLLADLKAMLEAHPELVQQVLAEQARSDPGPKPVTDTHSDPVSPCSDEDSIA